MKNKIETVDVNINQIAHSPIQMSKPVRVRSINFIEFDIPIPYSLKIESIFFLLNLNIYHEKKLIGTLVFNNGNQLHQGFRAKPKIFLVSTKMKD